MVSIKKLDPQPDAAPDVDEMTEALRAIWTACKRAPHAWHRVANLPSELVGSSAAHLTGLLNRLEPVLRDGMHFEVEVLDDLDSRTPEIYKIRRTGGAWPVEKD